MCVLSRSSLPLSFQHIQHYFVLNSSLTCVKLHWY
jgi:hypothetical protein